MTQLDESSLATGALCLAKRDKDLALLLKTYGTPPMWARSRGFSTLIRIILEQQVSLLSAAAMFERLKKNIVPLKPERVVQLGERELRALGLTRQKTAYFLHLSESLLEKRLNLSRLPGMTDTEAKAALMAVKGIGSWSADIYLLMALCRPDIWPFSDLALATAITRVRKLKQRPTPNRLVAIAEVWRPYRSIAARMLWQFYLAQRNGSGRERLR